VELFSLCIEVDKVMTSTSSNAVIKYSIGLADLCIYADVVENTKNKNEQNAVTNNPTNIHR
jgi:mannose-1-phosphate guanylyltransferase